LSGPLVANSVGDLIEHLTGKVGPICWYRGHRDANWDVQPTIWRDFDEAEERNFTNRFTSRAAIRYSLAPKYDEPSRWLPLMQHYGLPTRLLDWSRSPLVAVYFALECYIADQQRQTVDACIWVLRPHDLNRSEHQIVVTPSIESRLALSLVDPAFTESAPEPGTVMAVMAADTDMRMFIQQGAFTVHSRKAPLNVDPSTATHLTKIIIPAASVTRMALEIQICGFRRGDIYPDLANLAAELKQVATHAAIP